MCAMIAFFHVTTNHFIVTIKVLMDELRLVISNERKIPVS
jgi:hypothetical protein